MMYLIIKEMIDTDIIKLNYFLATCNLYFECMQRIVRMFHLLRLFLHSRIHWCSV